jgi:phosphoribosylglycinamide formyltransferase-1
MLRIGWFSTGRDEAACQLLQAVWQAIQKRDLNGEIAFVFSNREPGENPASDRFFDFVESYGVPLVCLSSKRFREERGEAPARAGQPLPPWRAEYDRALMRLLEPHPFDVGVLAGYMLIFTEEPCRRYNLLNLHPAQPGGPVGTWQNVIWRLMEESASTAGVMMHLATPELDQGPPVTYCTYDIRGPAFEALWLEIGSRSVAEVREDEGDENGLFREIRRQGVMRELPLIVATLRSFADGKVRIEGGQVLDTAGQPIAGYDLTEEIEAMVTRR